MQIIPVMVCSYTKIVISLSKIYKKVRKCIKGKVLVAIFPSLTILKNMSENKSIYHNDDQYFFTGDIPVNQIVEKYGAPLYVYDFSIIKRQFDKISNAFNTNRLRINYACKANTNINVLKYLKSLGSGLDTVSIQEVRLGLMAGYQPSQILFTPNCVSMTELRDAVSLGVSINLDNLSVLEQFGDEFPDYPVCVRINPHIMGGGNHNISTGHIDSKFGISIHQIPHIHRIVEAHGMKVSGLHMHTGSDILDVETFLLGADLLLEVALQFKNLEYIDFGSGFKVPYKEGDVSTDMNLLGEKFMERFDSFCTTYGKELDIVFEPGKYLVSESGSFLAPVNVIKQTTSTVFAGLDTGLNHLIRPMLYGSHHDIMNTSRVDGPTRLYTIVGYICETDTFGVNRRIKEISEGDVLAFSNSGAYCFSMASNYNSRYRPAEVAIIEGEHFLIRERENMEDLLAKQIQIPVL